MSTPPATLNPPPARAAILPWLGFALFLIVAIGVMGMTVSVIVAETVQGSGSAINVAGSLRKQSHLMGSLVLSDAENRVTDPARLRAAIAQFEASLDHPALNRALERGDDNPAAHTFIKVRTRWYADLGPRLRAAAVPGPRQPEVARHNALLTAIDAFVDDINRMVEQLEVDTETRIRQLRLILAVALLFTVVVAFAVLGVARRRVMRPLRELVDSTTRLARGDFAARTHYVEADEIGQLGRTFNDMADDLAKLYQDLEARVAEKTAALSRSNRSLELLYHAISRLHDAPLDGRTYRAMLEEIDALLELEGSMVCLFSRHPGAATTLASTLPACAGQTNGSCPCQADGSADVVLPAADGQDGMEIRYLALRDAERQYGVLKVALPAGRTLQVWQEQLLEALARHVGTALGTAHQVERERLLALQEERSVIARELHDSIAQALSYMKIQASLLQPVVAAQEGRAEAETILADLRAGISAAYRQLRELLATFRLKMEGDFIDLLEKTVDEFGQRASIAVDLEVHLAGCRLTPNQEIHVLQIIREALSNIHRHARAQRARIAIRHGHGMVEVSIEDDGVGVDPAKLATRPHHYGLGIMRERAASLGGELGLERSATGGTRVKLAFHAAHYDAASPAAAQDSP